MLETRLSHGEKYGGRLRGGSSSGTNPRDSETP
jgi:hypothetical protein